MIRETLSTLSSTISKSVLPAAFTAVKKAAGMISPKPLRIGQYKNFTRKS